ncbi:hypothetical protein NliqN6_1435 [Naganishia liquefaciens]|uniref:Uncharacterized protein n=1 Tax=Naganishia liquefaciens TaxID=104408 RepID=A0A8H3TQ02_9TREE|nr:hypothetical protein NliqN6_1435 [Naganishia liquefaciens]
MTQTSSASTESSTTASLPTSLPTSLSPRPRDTRKVSTATFGDGQRGSVLIPAHDATNLGNHGQSSTSPDEPSLPLQAVSSITLSQAKDVGQEPSSPTSLHTAARSCLSPLPVEVDGQPETPQTSTSVASYISDTSTLGPLATQQDIKDDPNRMVERRQVQRKKLEKMLGNGVDPDDDEAVAKGTAGKSAREAEGRASDQEFWIPVEHGPELCKSKLERFLGQGADSAHLVLNAEYRKRSRDVGDERLRKGLSTGVATSTPDTANRASSTSDVPGMVHVAETMGKPKRSGSLTNVLESGKKTLARLNHGPSALRDQRSNSLDIHSGSEIRNPQDTRGGASDWLLALDTELQERKILRKRTRKIGKVLGETLTENEVEEHVVGKGTTRRSENASELSSPEDGLEGSTSRLPTLEEDDSQLNLSLRPEPFKSDTMIKELLMPSGDLTSDGISGKYQRLSVPLSPTIDGSRRHSDPISPSQSSLTEENHVMHIHPRGEERREAYSTIQAKKQRRLRLDKLNRLLGVHVPLALLGPAVFPRDDTLDPGRAGKPSTDDELDEAHAAEKKRAVKVANKMFNLFGEPPPNPAYPLSVSLQDDPKEHSDDIANRPRTRFRSSVLIYRQTIGSIRYLLEHDRRSLGRVMDELDFGSIPADHLPDPFKSPSATSPDRYQSDRPKMHRKRSLSSPSKVSLPLASMDPAKAVFANIDSAHCPDFDCTTGLRKRAGKLNAFFGDPRVGSGYVGTRSKQYQITDRKAALEILLLDLEEDANFHAEQGDLKDFELEEIRSQLSTTRQVVGKELAANVEAL